jgi:Transposase IS4
MDNYFTSVPLFKELRNCEFGAVGTTRPHAEFPTGMKELKDRYSKKLEWNTLLAKVVQDTLCLAWQDNNIVLALSTVHTVHTAKDF